MRYLRKLNHKERKICGVCGGINKFIDPDLDPLGMRILWVVLTIFSPFFMIALYFILAATLKTELTIIQDEKFEKV